MNRYILLCLIIPFVAPAGAQTTTTFDSVLTTGTLTVIGTTTFQGDTFSVGGSTLVVSLGQVGIGTTTPHQALDVEGGNIRLPPTTASAGALYAGDFPFLHDYGTNNLFAGIYAGNFTLSGTNNVGIGYYSLNSNTSGASNTAVGFNALTANTTGFANSALGAQTLASNIGGISNTGAGDGALFSNLSGDDNDAFGQASLFSNTNGSFNSALGQSALIVLNSGDANVGIGYLALTDYMGGDSNIGIGDSAGYGGHGYFTGSNNIFIGANAHASYDVNSSVAIGQEAHADADNAVAIGLFARASSPNSIVLGGTGQYAADVGIGNDSPAAKLDAVMAPENSFALIISSADKAPMLSVDRKGVTAISNPSDSARLFGTALSIGGYGVYIGTADPVARLDDQSQGPDNRVWDMLSTGGQLVFRTMNDAGTSASNAITISRAGTTVTQTTFDNGMVGIGTTNPATSLDVNGSAQFGSTAKSTFSTNGSLTIANGATVTLSGANGNLASGSSITASAFFGDGSHLTGVGGTGPWLETGSVVQLSTPADNVVIQSTLTIQGNAFSVAASTLYVRGGYVGIDTTTFLTGGIFHAAAAANTHTYYDFDRESPAYNSALTWATNAYRLWYMGFLPSAGSANGDLTIYNTTSGRAIQTYQDSTGNVGIGTINPATSLDVSGSAQFGSAAKSTFSTTGSLTLADGAALALSGANGNIASGSSVTASAFFGDGSHLSGIIRSSSGLTTGIYTKAASATTIANSFTSEVSSGVTVSSAMAVKGTVSVSTDAISGALTVVPGSYSLGSTVFSTVGISSWTVPANVYQIYAKAWGAGGGGTQSQGFSGNGAGGSFASGMISVIPGEVLTVSVGGGGGKPLNALGGAGGTGESSSACGPGGAGGTDGPGATGLGGAGGGGASGIVRVVVSSKTLVCAGGGGGGAAQGNSASAAACTSCNTTSSGQAGVGNNTINIFGGGGGGGGAGSGGLGGNEGTPGTAGTTGTSTGAVTMEGVRVTAANTTDSDYNNFGTGGTNNNNGLSGGVIIYYGTKANTAFDIHMGTQSILQVMNNGAIGVGTPFPNYGLQISTPVYINSPLTITSSVTYPASIKTVVPKPLGSFTSTLTAATIGSLTTGIVGLEYIPQTILVSTITYNATITTPGTFKICVYDEDNTTKLIDVTSLTNKTGLNYVTVSPPVMLQPGNYYFLVGWATTATSTTLDKWTTVTEPGFNSAPYPGGKVFEGTITGRTSGACDATIQGTITGAIDDSVYIRLDQ